MFLLSFGGSWGYVGSFFAIFSHFGSFLDAAWAIFRFFCSFGRFFGFFVDFGWIWGWFFRFFSMIWGVSRRNREFAETLKKTRFLQCFVKVDLLKNNKNSTKNRWKINANFQLEKKHSRITLKSVLGTPWTHFGMGLGQYWVSSGRSWMFFGCSKPSFF